MWWDRKEVERPFSRLSAQKPQIKALEVEERSRDWRPQGTLLLGSCPGGGAAGWVPGMKGGCGLSAEELEELTGGCSREERACRQLRRRGCGGDQRSLGGLWSLLCPRHHLLTCPQPDMGLSQHLALTRSALWLIQELTPCVC